MREIDIKHEVQLRPSTLADYSGQDHIKEALNLYMSAAKLREEHLDHIIVYGCAGLGKSSLANIIANEMGCKLITIAAPTIKTVDDMINALMGIKPGTMLFIDEIHRLPTKVEEILYFAMEDFKITTGSDTDFVPISLPHFTLIGATTRVGLLSAPLRSRFGISIELRPYTEPEIANIVSRTAKLIGTEIDDVCAALVAQRSRGVPRLANGFLRRISDFALVKNNNVITKDIVLEAFKTLDIDVKGLNKQDRYVLTTIIERFKSGPVGISTLCSALNDDKVTIEETVEPYLIQNGLLERTPRGRVATKQAYDFLINNKEGRR